LKNLSKVKKDITFLLSAAFKKAHYYYYDRRHTCTTPLSRFFKMTQ